MNHPSGRRIAWALAAWAFLFWSPAHGAKIHLFNLEPDRVFYVWAIVPGDTIPLGAAHTWYTSGTLSWIIPNGLVGSAIAFTTDPTWAGGMPTAVDTSRAPPTRLAVYPSPSNGLVTIEAPESIDVYDVAGRRVLRLPGPGRYKLLIPSGSYFARSGAHVQRFTVTH